MGYNTIFEGKLPFVNEPSLAAIKVLKAMEGEDCRDHPEWGEPDLYYVDFRVTKDMDGIEWNDDTEKTYDAEKIVNLMIRKAREVDPAFALRGEILAQGEDCDDRWRLAIKEDGWAHRIDFPRIGQRITCPCCGEDFTLEETKE